MNKYIIPNNLAVSESGFLFMASSGESFTINFMGKAILDLLQRGKNDAEIIKQIITDYDVEKNSLEKDLSDFINQLKQYRILKEE